MVSDHEYRLPKSLVPANTRDVEFHFDEFTASAGADGYFLIPSVPARNHPTGLCRFIPHPDQELVFRYSDMPIFGVKNGNNAILAVVAGMSMTYSLVVGVKDGRYYCYPRFHCEEQGAYEDPVVLFFHLEGEEATWSGMARAYRAYQLGRKACISLRERSKQYPVVGETTAALPIRIRHAWKPMPTSVLDQIPGVNEPPLTVAVTFRRQVRFWTDCMRLALNTLISASSDGTSADTMDASPTSSLLTPVWARGRT